MWGDLGDYPNGYREVKEAAYTSDQGLFIWDPQFFQVTRYNGGGEVLRQISLRTRGKSEWRNELVQGLHFTHLNFVFFSVPANHDVLAPVVAHFWRADPPDFAPKRFLDVEAFSDRQAGADLQPPVPFERPIQHWALTDDGTIWYLAPDTVFRLDRFTTGGNGLTETVIAIHPAPSNSAEVLKTRDDHIIRTLSRHDSSALQSPCKRPNTIKCLTFHFFDSAAKLTTHYPIIEDIVPSADNSIWMRSAYPRADSVRWTHFTPAGLPNGMIVLSAELTISQAHSAELVLRQRKPNNGNLGIQFAVVRTYH